MVKSVFISRCSAWLIRRPLNVLRDAASELPLEAALELRLAHAGDARKALERDIKGVVVGNVADHVLQPL